MQKHNITQDELKAMLDYNPDTGKFTWRVNHRRVVAGMQAGCLNDKGHLRITLNKKSYAATHLAWLYVYGEWPTYRLRCINKNISDTRIVNLKEAKPEPLTQTRLQNTLAYDANTGVCTWKQDVSNVKAGAVAGYKHHSGYIYISVDGIDYGAHRLIWLLVHGKWPDHEIDHINRIRDDNRLINLREACDTMQARNRSTPRTNTSGRQGVSWHKATNKWSAKYCAGGRSVWLGVFDSVDAAGAVYDTAMAKIHTAEKGSGEGV